MPGAGHRPPLFASWPGAAALPLTLVFNNFPAHAWQNIEGVPHIFLLEYNINASQHTTFMLVHPPIRQLPRSSNIDKDLPIRLAQRFMCSTLEYSAADLWSPGDATQTDLGQSFDAYITGSTAKPVRCSAGAFHGFVHAPQVGGWGLFLRLQVQNTSVLLTQVEFGFVLLDLSAPLCRMPVG